MDRVLLLLVYFFGTTAAQQRFDSMGLPMFEVVTPLSQTNSRPLLAVDFNGASMKQIPVDPHKLPLPQVPPLSSMSQSPLPPQPQQLPPLQQILSPPPPVQIASRRQPAEIDGLPHLSSSSSSIQRQPQLSSQVMTAPFLSRLGILNQDRIHVEGFQPIERRTTKRRRSPKLVEDWSSFKEDASNEDFLPVDASRKLSDVETFDQSDSAVNNDLIEGGSGNSEDSRNLPNIDSTSTIHLHPGSGYKESATQLSNELSKFNNLVVSRMQHDEDEEKSNSILDGEGSAFGEDMSDVGDRKIESPSFRSFNIPLKKAKEETGETESELETTSELPVSTTDYEVVFTSTSTLNAKFNLTTVVQKSSTLFAYKPLVPSPVTASPNSVPFIRDSRLSRIVKEYAGLIVGIILGIPAIVVLCYFIYLKRLKRYTGTLDVSPRQTIYINKKSESRQTICSEENELACSPSTCASKTPQPPPFPICKRYVP